MKVTNRQRHISQTLRISTCEMYSTHCVEWVHDHTVWSWFHVHRSIHEDIDFLHFRCQWPWPLTFWHQICSNHSLFIVDHRRWRLATADVHSIVFLLHCSLSCDISFSWMYSYNHYTLLCRPSIVFWVFLGDVNHVYCPPRLSVPNLLHFPW